MKKILTLLIVICLLTACSKPKTEISIESKENTIKTEIETEEETQTIDTNTISEQETSNMSNVFDINENELNKDDLVEKLLPIINFNGNIYDLRNNIQKDTFIKNNDLQPFTYKDSMNLSSKPDKKEKAKENTSNFTENNKDENILIDFKDNTLIQIRQSFMYIKNGNFIYAGNIHKDIANITYPFNLKIGDDSSDFMKYVDLGIFEPTYEKANEYKNIKNPDCINFEYTIFITNNQIADIKIKYIK